MNAGFVIGTGDLSELALGWCTYNADHMSMYNPNVSIPKTLVKFLVRWAAENEFDGEARRDAARHRRHGDLAGAAADRTRRADRAGDRGDDRPVRAARLLPVPLPALRGAAGEDPVPGAAREVRPGRTRRTRCGSWLRVFLTAVLRQPVQAVVPAGRAEGRLGQPVAARRLADAERRRGRGRGWRPRTPVRSDGGSGGGRGRSGPAARRRDPIRHPSRRRPHLPAAGLRRRQLVHLRLRGVDLRQPRRQLGRTPLLPRRRVPVRVAAAQDARGTGRAPSGSWR